MPIRTAGRGCYNIASHGHPSRCIFRLVSLAQDCHEAEIESRAKNKQTSDAIETQCLCQSRIYLLKEGPRLPLSSTVMVYISQNEKVTKILHTVELASHLAGTGNNNETGARTSCLAHLSKIVRRVHRLSHEREWKTLNLVSVLLLSCVLFLFFFFPRFSDWHNSAILAVFQIQGGRATTQSHAWPPSYPSYAHSPVSHTLRNHVP
jgi:hypothetical protein